MNLSRRLILVSVMLYLGAPALTWGQASGVMVFDDEALLDRITSNGKKLLDAKQLVRLPTLVKQLSRTSCSLTLAPVQTSKRDAKEVFEISRQGTLAVGLLARDEETGEWFFNAATGFVLTADGAIGTSYHVLLQDELPVSEVAGVTQPNDTPSKPQPPEKHVGHDESYLIAADFAGNVYPVREVLAADKVSDTCILKIEARGLTPLPLNPETRPGETVFCFSNPSDMFGHFSQGIISRFFVIREPVEPGQKPTRPVCFMSVSADFAVGSSGGPILDDRGNVVGQVQSTSSIFADADEEHPQHPQMVIKAALAVREILALIKQPKTETTLVATERSRTPVKPIAKKTATDDAITETYLAAPPIVFATEAILATTEPSANSAPGITRITLHFKHIQADYEAESARLLALIDAAQTDQRLTELKQEVARLVTRTEAQCYRLINAYPSHPEILPVLEYLVLHSELHQARAFELLTKHHITSSEVGKTCVYLRGNYQNHEPNAMTFRIQKLARAIIRQNCHHEAVGLATLILAELVADTAEDGRRKPAMDRDALREAQTLYLKVSQNFAGVRIPDTGKPDGSVSVTFAGAEAESGLRRLHDSTRRELQYELKRSFFFDRNVARKPGSSTLGLR